jgi:hypothetical protein
VTGEDKVQSISIYNVNGQLVHKTTDTEQESNIDVSALLDGMYFISVQTEDEILTSKFMKR